VRFLWEAASARAGALAPPVTRDPSDPAFANAKVVRFSAPPTIDRVRMRVRITTIDPAVIGALVASGDLDPAVATRIPLIDLASTHLEWTKERGFGCIP
jgi:hypothetical protein